MEDRHRTLQARTASGLYDLHSHSIGRNVIRSAYQTSRSYIENTQDLGTRWRKELGEELATPAYFLSV